MAVSEKTKRWLEQNCLPDLSGKRVLITGATSGVGLKTAELLIYLKASVIMACRNTEKAERIRAELKNEYPQAEIRIMRLDLADFNSIDGFVSEIKRNEIDIDVFLNNAGVFRKPGERTEQGFDMVLGTNYLGLFYLTESILPYLKKLPHEVLYINTVSIIHKVASEKYEACFRGEKTGSLSLYGCSKLCLSKYTYELAKISEGSNIRVLMNHPGIAITPLGVNAFGATVKHLSNVFGWVFNSPEKSALALPLIMSKNIPAGSIIGPNKFFGGWGYPKVNRVCRKVKTGARGLIVFTKKEIDKIG